MRRLALTLTVLAACGSRTAPPSVPAAETRGSGTPAAAAPAAGDDAASAPSAESSPATPATVADAGASVPDDFTISLEMRACLGTCPVYTVTVDARGAVFFAGWYPERGCASVTIPAAVVADLAHRVDAIGFFDLADRYTDPVTDHPWAITTVAAGGRKKTIAHYLADRLDAPDLAARQALTTLEEAVAGATRSARAPLGPCGGKSPYPGVP